MKRMRTTHQKIVGRLLVMYVPQESSFPILLKHIRVMFQTLADLECSGERTIKYYGALNSDKTLSDDCVGRTRFHIFRSRPLAG